MRLEKVKSGGVKGKEETEWEKLEKALKIEVYIEKMPGAGIRIISVREYCDSNTSGAITLISPVKSVQFIGKKAEALQKILEAKTPYQRGLKSIITEIADAAFGLACKEMEGSLKKL